MHVTDILTDLTWDTLQHRRNNYKIHNLVEITPDPPLARPAEGTTNASVKSEHVPPSFRTPFFTATIVLRNNLPQVAVDQASLDAFQSALAQQNTKY
jgi:hypothetical protein